MVRTKLVASWKSEANRFVSFFFFSSRRTSLISSVYLARSRFPVGSVDQTPRGRCRRERMRTDVSHERAFAESVVSGILYTGTAYAILETRRRVITAEQIVVSRGFPRRVRRTCLASAASTLGQREASVIIAARRRACLRACARLRGAFRVASLYSSACASATGFSPDTSLYSLVHFAPHPHQLLLWRRLPLASLSEHLQQHVSGGGGLPSGSCGPRLTAPWTTFGHG